MVLVYQEEMGAQHSVTNILQNWEEWDLTLSGAPGNCVAEILVEYPGVFADGDLEAYPGVREKGSALERTHTLSPQRSSDSMATFRVNVDEDGVIEIKDNYLNIVFPSSVQVPHCLFRVIGWFKGATYIELEGIHLGDTDGAWDATDIFTSHGVPKGSVCDVAIGCEGDDGVEEVGIRNPDDAGYKYKLNDCAYGIGLNAVYIWCKTDTTNGEIEFWCDEDSHADGYVMGYWEIDVDYDKVQANVVPSGASAWVNHNLTGIGVIKNGIPCLVGFNREDATVNLCGIREDAATALSRYRNVDYGFNDTHATCISMCIRAITDNATVELYTGDVTDAFFICDGYLHSKYPLAKIDGVSLANIAKIDGVSIDDVAGVNGYPIT